MRPCSPPNVSRGAGRASSNHRLRLTPHHDRGSGPLWPAPACRKRGPSDLFGHLGSGRACRDRHGFHSAHERSFVRGEASGVLRPARRLALARIRLFTGIAFARHPGAAHAAEFFVPRLVG
jgi:hypothetical protein